MLEILIRNIIFFIFGTIIGSFLNVVIYRVPLEQSILLPPSHCPNCKSKIHFYDNIPILSYFLLKGKCRQCSERISYKYPLNEFITGIVFVFLYHYTYPDILKWLSLFIIFCFLLVIFWIDIEHQLILDIITFPFLIICYNYSYFIDKNIESSLIASVLGPLFLLFTYYLSLILFKKEGIGLGDVKLAAVLGAWLGIQKLFIGLFISFFIGILIGGILFFKRGKSDYFAFGPAMVLGAITAFFFGNNLWLFYLNIFL